VRTGRQTDRQKVTTNLIVTFRKFADASKKAWNYVSTPPHAVMAYTGKSYFVRERKRQAIPVQACTGPYSSRRFRFAQFLDNRHNFGFKAGNRSTGLTNYPYG